MPNCKCPPDDLAIYLPKIREDHFNTHPRVKKWSSLCSLPKPKPPPPAPLEGVGSSRGDVPNPIYMLPFISNYIQ